MGLKFYHKYAFVKKVNFLIFFGRLVVIYLLAFVGRICETEQLTVFIYSVVISGHVGQPIVSG